MDHGDSVLISGSETKQSSQLSRLDDIIEEIGRKIIYKCKIKGLDIKYSKWEDIENLSEMWIYQ